MLYSNSKYSSIWLYLISFIFIGLNAFFIYKGNYFFSLIPLTLVVMLMSFFYMKELLFFVIVCTPFSLNLESLDTNSSFGFYLPTEPILFGLSILLIIRQLHRGSYSKSIVNHPLTISIFIYLTWLFISSFASEHPMVSFKFLISKLWFFIPLYFYGILIFKEEKNINLVQWLYLVPLVIVVIITVIRHYGYGFDQEIAHWIMSPFFKDHTSYGAIVAFFIPISLFMLFQKNNSPLMQISITFILVVLIIGLVYSFTRAAWISLLASLVVYLLFRFKVKFKYVSLAALIAGIIALSQFDQINMALSKNKTDSTKNISNHIQSVSNISTDASNLERINRWNSAIEMFKERPFFGWGGGTYAFEYAPFQHSSDLTPISTNFGNKGNAHSEYLGAFAETGVLGGLSFLLIVFFLFYRAGHLYITLPDGNLKLMIMGIMLALVSYFTHGFLNNYLDTDKASVPVWISAAIIVSVDLLYSTKKLKK